MFVWECLKTEGRHLGMCMDGFMFGSCCVHSKNKDGISNHNDDHDDNHANDLDALLEASAVSTSGSSQK